MISTPPFLVPSKTVNVSIKIDTNASFQRNQTMCVAGRQNGLEGIKDKTITYNYTRAAPFEVLLIRRPITLPDCTENAARSHVYNMTSSFILY